MLSYDQQAPQSHGALTGLHDLPDCTAGAVEGRVPELRIEDNCSAYSGSASPAEMYCLAAMRIPSGKLLSSAAGGKPVCSKVQRDGGQRFVTRCGLYIRLYRTCSGAKKTCTENCVLLRRKRVRCCCKQLRAMKRCKALPDLSMVWRPSYPNYPMLFTNLAQDKDSFMIVQLQ